LKIHRPLTSSSSGTNVKVSASIGAAAEISSFTTYVSEGFRFATTNVSEQMTGGVATERKKIMFKNYELKAH
jgi:hypothetical protein